MMLRFTEDGHVATIDSQLGHSITLSIAGGQIVLTLTSPEEEQQEVASQQQAGEETFALVVSCIAIACIAAGAHNPQGRSVKLVIPPIIEWHLQENSYMECLVGWLLHY